MPFQPINFASIQPQGLPFMRNLVETLMRGYQAGQIPAQMRRQAQQQELENQYKQAQTEQMQNELSRQKLIQNLINQGPQQSSQQTQQPSLVNSLFPQILQQQQQQQQQNQGPQLQQQAQQNPMMSLSPEESTALKRVYLGLGPTLPSETPYKFLPSGAAQDVAALEVVKKLYGEDSPQAQAVQKNIDIKQQGKMGQTAYYNSLTQNAGKRFDTPMGKLITESSDIDAGFQPGTNRTVQITPEQQQDLKGQYANKMLKESTDQQTRQKSLFASNIDKTLEGINPKDLTQYSGLEGAAKLKSDQIQSGLGKPSDSFSKYNKALTLSNLLAKQVRQFYGDSITPEVQGKLASLTNPSTWQNDPKVAIENFNTFKDILKKETGTYRGALKSTKEYQGTTNQPSTTKRLKFNPSTGGFE